jgi:hypothetical protein
VVGGLDYLHTFDALDKKCTTARKELKVTKRELKRSEWQASRNT